MKLKITQANRTEGFFYQFLVGTNAALSFEAGNLIIAALSLALVGIVALSMYRP